MEQVTPRPRVVAIDALRGLAMVIMALDHVRDFIHRGAMTGSPTDLATTTPALFFTRWVTHFCAPTFMFTAGLGAFFWWRQGRSRRQLSAFLLTRGLWLLVLELTVMRLAYDFNFSGSSPVFLLVLWVLGACMIGLAALVWLPAPVLAAAALATVALHNGLDGLSAERLGAWWNLVHQPGAFPVAGALVIVGYPVVPWIAVMALGFAAGPLFLAEPARRRRWLVRTGLAAIAGFLLLRALNAYGDPAPWSGQKSPVLTALSFLNTTKYPPSLAFLLMTLGPGLLALAGLERLDIRPTHPLVALGRVPLFYFVTHFFAAHAAAAGLALLTYGRSALGFVFNLVPSMGAPPGLYPADFGFSLEVAYLVWAAVVVGLYPACRWFQRVKAIRRSSWVSYL